jgi:UDPglucose 6-dehydrogenase
VKIAVVGTGYVGLVTGTCLAETGHDVTCVDVDQAKIDLLRAGGIPIYEPGLEELVRRNVKEGRLRFTTSTEEAMRDAAVAFIAVGTPPGETGEADLSYVLAAAEALGRHIRRYTVVVNKSTVPAGSADAVREVVAKVAQAEFDVVSNPEFLKEGAAIDDFMRPDRIVVGASSERARAVMADLYAPFVRTEQPILFMDPRSAELTKYAANAMLATRISFMNDVAGLCERLGADVDQVRRGMGSDKRIGYPFLFPGAGFGGSCLAGQETVLVRQGRRTRLVSLEALFEALAGPDAPAAAAVRVEGVEVLSWRPGREGPEFLPVAAVTRRPYRGEAVEVRTKMGRRALCTADHPFVVGDREGRSLGLKLAADLGPGDWLPLALGNPPAGARATAAPAGHLVPLELDLLEAVAPAGLEAANVLVQPGIREGMRLAELGAGGVHRALAPLGHPRGRERAQDVVRHGTLRLPEVQALGLSLHGARASSARNGTRVPVSILADERFWRVVGLYLSEGHCSADGRRRRLAWSFHPTREDDLADEVASYWRDQGVKADVRRTGTALHVSVSSRLLASLFVDVLGLGADCYGHRIPDPIWDRPAREKRALLAGLWRGDGSWSLVRGGPSVVLEYGTASRELADGMLRLLGDLGVVARWKVGRTSKSTVDTHWIAVSGADQVEQLLDLVPPRDREGIRTSLARQAKRIAPTGWALTGGAARVRVASVSRRPFAGPVYSVEVPGAETYVTTGGLVVHNCFPKDVRALMTMARAEGLDFDLLRAVERVNERQKRSLVEKALKHFGSLQGKTIGVWGLAFKPKTDDMREAPSITVVEGLIGNGARVRAHDPVAEEVASRLFQGRVELAREPYAVAEGADALVLVTEWNEFRQPDFERLKRIMRQPVLFDGRNVWDREKVRALGFTYYGIGRR